MNRMESSSSPSEGYKNGKVHEIGIRLIKGYGDPDCLQLFSRGRLGFRVLTTMYANKRCFSANEIQDITNLMNKTMMDYMILTPGVQLTLSAEG